MPEVVCDCCNEVLNGDDVIYSDTPKDVDLCSSYYHEVVDEEDRQNFVTTTVNDRLEKVGVHKYRNSQRFRIFLFPLIRAKKR
jgi:hypothetical protein